MNNQLECRLCGKGYNDIDEFALICDVVYHDNEDSEGLVIFVCPDCFKKYRTEIMSMLMLDYLDIIINQYDKYITTIAKLAGNEHLTSLIKEFKEEVLQDMNDEPLDGDEAIALAAALLQLINFHQGIDDKKEWEEDQKERGLIKEESNERFN
jgi:hypothetical protein